MLEANRRRDSNRDLMESRFDFAHHRECNAQSVDISDATKVAF